MATLAALVVKLTADTGDFKKGMDESASTVSRFTSGIGKNVQNLGKVALGGLAVVGTAAVGAGIALGKFAMDAAVLETVEGAFRGVAEGSGESADAMLAALKRGSSGMIAQRDLMMTYNKAAQLVGTTFANQLPDAMQYLQKVSAATGQDMGFMLDSLVTGVGRLSPMILDNLGIQVALSEATERASEMFGVEAGELTKAQQQAGMMNVVLEKLQKNTANMPDVSDSAAAGIARMRAKFQDFKDQLGKAFLPVLTAVIDILGQLMNWIGPAVIKVVEKISQVFGAFANYIGIVLEDGDTLNDWLTHLPEPIRPIVKIIGELVRTFLYFVDTLSGGFGRVFEEFGPLEFILQGLQPLIGNISQTVWDFVAQIDNLLMTVGGWIGKNVELKDVLIALGIAIASVIVPAILGIIAAVLPLIATAAALILAVSLVRNAWEKDWGGIRTFVSNVITAIRTFWAENGEAILAKAKDVYETVRNVITTTLQTVKSIISAALAAIRAWWQEHGDQVMATVRQFMTTAWNTIQTIISTIQTVVTTILEAIRAFWETHGDQIIEIVTSFMTLAQTVITEIINIIQSVVTTVLSAVQDFWDAHGASILSIAEGAWTAIKDVIDALLQIIQGIIDAVSAAIEGDWESFGQALQDIWDAAWGAIKSIVENIVPEIVGFIGGLVTDIKNKITEVDWAELGRSIINGIKDGVVNAAKALANAVSGAVSDALGAAKGLLGIGSPSRVFLEQVGRPMMLGWAAGLRDTRPIEMAVRDAARVSIGVAMEAPALRASGVNIYGDVHLHDVKDGRGVLEELYALGTGA